MKSRGFSSFLNEISRILEISFKSWDALGRPTPGYEAVVSMWLFFEQLQVALLMCLYVLL